MPTFQYEANGKTYQYDAPRKASNEQLQAQFHSQQPQEFQQEADLQTQPMYQGSPISLGDRVALGFSDERGKQNLLRKKFQYVNRLEDGNYLVGNSPTQALPLNPDSMFEDGLATLANHVADIPVISGQVAGAVGGELLAPEGGGVIGAGLGAAAGQEVSHQIGKALGVNEMDAQTAATDNIISGAFGAGGEFLAAKFMRPQGKVLSNEATNVLQKTVFEHTQPNVALDRWSKVLNFVGGADEGDARLMAAQGFKPLSDSKYNNSNYIRTLMNDYVSDIKSNKEFYGEQLEKGKTWLAENMGNKRVNANETLNSFVESLKNDQIIDPITGVLDSQMLEPKEYKAVSNVLNHFYNKEIDKNLVAKYTPKQLTIANEISKEGRRFSTSGKLGLLEPGTTKGVLHGLDKIGSSIDELGADTELGRRFTMLKSGLNADLVKTIVPNMDESIRAGLTTYNTRAIESDPRLKNLVMSNPYLRGNYDYSNFVSKMSNLEKMGIPTLSAIKSPEAYGDIVNIGLENAFSKFQKTPQTEHEYFKSVIDSLPKSKDYGTLKTIFGPKKAKLYDELFNYNAVQNIKGINPNVLRMSFTGGAIGSALGGSQAVKGLVRAGVVGSLFNPSLIGKAAEGAFGAIHGEVGAESRIASKAVQPVVRKFLASVASRGAKNKLTSS